jgi:hypothetical protein
VAYELPSSNARLYQFIILLRKQFESAKKELRSDLTEDSLVMAKRSEIVKIIKYPNRRLYLVSQNGNLGGYIKTEDLLQMIHNEQDFFVITKNEGIDITLDVLIEALRNQIKAGASLVTAKFVIDILKGKHAP